MNGYYKIAKIKLHDLFAILQPHTQYSYHRKPLCVEHNDERLYIIIPMEIYRPTRYGMQSAHQPVYWYISEGFEHYDNGHMFNIASELTYIF